MNKIYLNGPVNYVKLFNAETQQTVHIFMDYNEDLEYQHKCDQRDSKDIDKYLYQLLKSTDEVTDFFLEIMPSVVNEETPYNKNDNYLGEIHKMFIKLHKELNNNPIINNIRLHCINIADYTFLMSIIYNFVQAKNVISTHNSANGLQIITYLSVVINKLQFIIDTSTELQNGTIIKETLSNDLVNLSHNINIQVPNNDINKKAEILNNVLKELLYKILIKYENTTNKENIINYFNSEFIDISTEIIRRIQILKLNIYDMYKKYSNQEIKQETYYNNIKLTDKITKLFIGYGINFNEYFCIDVELNSEMIILNNYMKSLMFVMMDCFFIRRILEKGYINKSIVYTNIRSSCMYVWFLIKYSNFKIMDTSYLNTDKLDIKNPLQDFENKTKKFNHYSELYKYIIPSKLTQCIEINPI